MMHTATAIDISTRAGLLRMGSLEARTFAGKILGREVRSLGNLSEVDGRAVAEAMKAVHEIRGRSVAGVQVMHSDDAVSMARGAGR